MDNNNLITIASIEERKELLIDIHGILEPQPECCIYKVPKDVRRVNEEAYTPQVISIGPLHHGKKELLDMEKQKIRYQREFSKRISEEKWQEFITFIEVHEQRMRNCYEEMPEFQKLDFIAMILYDAIFIIELFQRYQEDKNDFLLSKSHVRSSIRLDLQLLENQLPYFVIEALYKLAFSSGHHNPSFFLLSCEFFYDRHMFNAIPEEVQVKHFTDLRRHVITCKYPKPESGGWLMELPCSVKLHHSGLKFKRVEGECLLDIRFVKKNKLRIIPWFQKLELQIPRIEVYDETELLIRNVMALEQCHYPSETYVCNYSELMDNLINTEEDVNLLIEAGIISNQVGDTARITNMFNKFGQQIQFSHSCYHSIAKDVQAHYENPWNHAKATLKSVYFSNPWRGAATVAAIVLLLLTFIQTCILLDRNFVGGAGFQNTWIPPESLANMKNWLLGEFVFMYEQLNSFMIDHFSFGVIFSSTFRIPTQ